MRSFLKSVGLMLRRTPLAKVTWVTLRSSMVFSEAILPAGPKSV